MQGMELVTRIAGVGLVVAIWLVLLRGRLPEFAFLMMLGFVAVALMTVLQPLSGVVATFGRLNRAAGSEGAYFAVVLKAVGIAYVAGFAAQLCRDAGQDAVAMTVELAGKVAILVVALPVFVALLDTLWRLLPV